MNALYSSEGIPVALNIPDPASLRIESTYIETSPDGRWQALATESEQVSLDGDLAFFFYVELTVTSLEDGRTWKPVSEWHVYGLGHEPAPRPFLWSQDGRYLYYTSLIVPDGACGFFANSGEFLDRLDLTNGSVAVLQPPYSRWMLAISPDETRMAYLSASDGSSLIVRDLAVAYTEGPAGEVSIQWQIPLEIVSPEVVSQIDWSPDGQKVLVTVAEIANNCQPAQVTEWTLEVETGEFLEGTTLIYPTPTP
jgi:WD40 repeat protein